LVAVRGKHGALLAGRYRLLEQLGEGGMGSVWKAEHQVLDSQVAIKIIDPDVARLEFNLARFLREAKTLASLRSPHVVQVLDFGSDADTPYLVMELLQGQTLGRRLSEKGRLSLGEISRVMSDVCSAMSLVHEQGLIHRDLKPENIFLCGVGEQQVTKVVDFGIAKSLRGELPASMKTRTGHMLGTPSYMSPEQCRGLKDIDHRADLWALGVIVYECLLGKVPFEGEVLGDLLLRICMDPLPVPSQQFPSQQFSSGQFPSEQLPLQRMLAGSFDAWFAKAVARDRTERFQSARELAVALAELSRSAAPRSEAPPTEGVASAPVAAHAVAPDAATSPAATSLAATSLAATSLAATSPAATSPAATARTVALDVVQAELTRSAPATSDRRSEPRTEAPSLGRSSAQLSSAELASSPSTSELGFGAPPSRRDSSLTSSAPRVEAARSSPAAVPTPLPPPAQRQPTNTETNTTLGLLNPARRADRRTRLLALGAVALGLGLAGLAFVDQRLAGAPVSVGVQSLRPPYEVTPKVIRPSVSTGRRWTPSLAPTAAASVTPGSPGPGSPPPAGLPLNVPVAEGQASPTFTSTPGVGSSVEPGGAPVPDVEDQTDAPRRPVPAPLRGTSAPGTPVRHHADPTPSENELRPKR
jgi:serine/threonine protein kinase